MQLVGAKYYKGKEDECYNKIMKKVIIIVCPRLLHRRAFKGYMLSRQWGRSKANIKKSASSEASRGSLICTAETPVSEQVTQQFHDDQLTSCQSLNTGYPLVCIQESDIEPELYV